MRLCSLTGRLGVVGILFAGLMTMWGCRPQDVEPPHNRNLGTGANMLMPPAVSPADRRILADQKGVTEEDVGSAKHRVATEADQDESEEEEAKPDEGEAKGKRKTDRRRTGTRDEAEAGEKSSKGNTDSKTAKLIEQTAKRAKDGKAQIPPQAMMAMMSLQGGEQILFPAHKVKLSVPKGWKVVKREKKGESAFCVLQDAKSGKVKTTICLWVGEEFIKASPKHAGNKAGTAEAACYAATQKALSWAFGSADKKPPKTEADPVAVLPVFGPPCAMVETKNKLVTAIGLSSSERKDGPVTLACATELSSKEEVAPVFMAIAALVMSPDGKVPGLPTMPKGKRAPKKAPSKRPAKK